MNVRLVFFSPLLVPFNLHVERVDNNTTKVLYEIIL